MPRALTALVLTAIAATLLFRFHPSRGKVSLGAPVAAAPTTTTKTPSGSHAARSTRRSHTASRATRRTVVGAPVQDPYGIVQVAVTLRGKRILDVRPVQIPLDSGRSQSINMQAGPMLRSEVLQAQSAQIDVISGATFTSEAYARSLQAALARAQA
jgi:uncharacterized protein with FMN-binding domain